MTRNSTKHIAEAIYQTAKNKSGVQLEQAIKMSVEFLAKKNLLSKGPEILKYMEHFFDAENNIVRAKVSSKNPLTKTETGKIESLLTARYKTKTPAIEWKEDKTLIGGVRIEAKDEVIDLSLKNKVNQLQTYLLTN